MSPDFTPDSFPYPWLSTPPVPLKPEAGDAVFLSDVHLGGFDDELNDDIERRLHELLHYVMRHELRLYLLGDLFDYWMEYRGRWPAYAEGTLRLFEQLNRRQPSLFITGNHDNWTGPRIEAAGFDIEHEYRMLKLAGRRILMLHGDGLREAGMNFRRPRFHRFLRHPAFLKLYQTLLPPAAGIALMQAFSRNAKRRDRRQVINMHEGAEDIDRWALQMLQHKPVDVVLCGHHHKPLMHESRHGLYVNLGNFCRLGSLLIHTRAGFRSVVWSSQAGGLLPFRAPELSSKKRPA